MVENVQRKILFIASLLVLAAVCMFVPEEPFRLGLDLQGGTRLVYRFDFDKAVADGQIEASELQNKTLLKEEFIRIVRQRIDPQGVLEPVLRSEGEDRVVIELPGISDLSTAAAAGTLAEELTADATAELALEGTLSAEELANFPLSGGTVGLGPERISYRQRIGSKLTQLKRGLQGTSATAHSTGEDVVLVSNDAIKNAIENTGRLAFYLGAEAGDLAALGSDLETERAKVTTWIGENPDTPLSEFNALPPEAGGPVERLSWAPRRQDPDLAAVPLVDRIAPLLLSDNPDYRFSGEDLQSTGMSSDNLGLPAVAFKMADKRKADFTDFTRENKGRLMGIVLGEEIVTIATINEILPGSGIINGGARGFKIAEVNEMVTLLRSGSLRIKPILEEEERVGASLGDEYVKKGFFSAIAGLLLVLVFVVIYYRKLGVLAATSLIFNLILLMGVMAFLRATLTLPGIAGIILTVGMAVDANILIYERIREETERGGKILQSAKNGFAKALSTVVDANLTTFITAVVLYKIGTGPVRGFATTLSIGILTSMFSALFVTRLLVHLSIERGTKKFTMSKLVGKTTIPFMARAKVLLPISIGIILVGISYFIYLPDQEKLSIDFMGGFTVTARTEEPQKEEDIRELIRAIPGEIGSADVKASLDSGSKESGYTKFRITSKNPGGAATAEGGQEQTGESEVRKALESVLQKGPIEVALASADIGQSVTGRLYFEEDHSKDDIAGALEGATLEEVSVTALEGRSNVFDFQATVPVAKNESALVNSISNVFSKQKDSAGSDYRLASPIPNVASVGAQVVGELRDKAIIAILISLFAVVLYIRARFAEYAYGFAAVGALIHDVLFTLGILSVVIHFGLVEAEISLPMIAAFLTIIGYSLNDTIVVFDRVRENRPRMKGALSDILDASINQTLSRTILTSLTTLVTVLILFLFNVGSGNVLEGFAFALIIGVVIGTYSSMFVATPLFLWLEKRFGDPDSHPELAAEAKASESAESNAVSV